MIIKRAKRSNTWFEDRDFKGPTYELGVTRLMDIPEDTRLDGRMHTIRGFNWKKRRSAAQSRSISLL